MFPILAIKPATLHLTFLNSRLFQSPILAYLDFSLQFEMHTDASAMDIGFSLDQIQERRERAIAYGGRDLSPSETNYSPTEREALAIVSDIRMSRNNLYGNKFTIHIDHNYSLKW